MGMRIIGIILMLAALSGCVPGEAEFTFKTSDVRKALQGEVTQVRLHESMTTTLSNAYDTVSFGGGRFTNKLDVVKALVAKTNGRRPFNLKDNEWTNDTVRVWVEDRSGELPCVRMEADICLALGRKEALEKRTEGQKLDELCALLIDAETGKMEAFREGKSAESLNPRLVAFVSALEARVELLELLFGKDEKDLLAVDQSLFAVVIPTWFKKLSCVVVGDSDEPLYVIADDAKVNGKPMKRFEGFVKKGEKIRFELDKDKHKEDGGLRFLLKTDLGKEIKDCK